MADLSPAAKALLDAFNSRYLTSLGLAAALRAAADQVVPEGKVYMETVTNAGVFVSTKPPARFRSKLLAIAAELEQLND